MSQPKRGIDSRSADPKPHETFLRACVQESPNGRSPLEAVSNGATLIPPIACFEVSRTTLKAVISFSWDNV